MASNKEPSTGRGETTQTTGSRGSHPTKPTTSLNQGKAGNIPRFLVIKRIDEGNFDKVSPFVISKSLFGLIGNLKNIKKIKEGLLIETVSEAQAKRLLKVEKVETFNVTVEPHKSLNNSKGIIVCPDLLNCTEAEILEEMETEGVINVRRIKKRVNGELVDTSSHILTFSRPKLPVKVKVAFYSLDVRPYIPNPLRCFNCQKFGHTSFSCNDIKICACGKPPHLGEVCQDPVKCVNCQGSHSAKSRKCPRMIEETNIQKVKVLENLSYAEARKKVCGPRTNSNTTYAQVASTGANTTILQLIPDITKVIENQIKAALNNINAYHSGGVQQASSSQQSLPMNPPQYTPKITSYTLNKSGSVSDASHVTTSEKRKRTNVNYSQEDSLDSDESHFSSQASDASRDRKKKRGWPKGKPRKSQDGQNMPS